MEKEYQVLELYGVPKKRAGSVANGIMVLATRYEKEIAALRAEVASLRINQQPQECNAVKS